MKDTRDRAALAEVEELLADAIAGSDHPQIASVTLRPSGPDGWCRLRVGFADGSTVYLGIEDAR